MVYQAGQPWATMITPSPVTDDPKPYSTTNYKYSLVDQPASLPPAAIVAEARDAWFTRFRTWIPRSRLLLVLLILPTTYLIITFIVRHPTVQHVSSSFTKSGSGSSSGKSVGIAQGAFLYGTATPEMNPYQEHPIQTLMREAQQEWDGKVARQSRTYSAAVTEYRRRYRRSPPPGFRDWFNWAKDHDVHLVDEFDMIMDHITPFFSLTPQKLRERIQEMEDFPSPATHAILRIRNHQKEPWVGANWRAPITDSWDIYLKEITQYLPDMDVAINLHDGPFVNLDAVASEAYRTAGRTGKLVNESSLPLTQISEWPARARTCSASSRYKREILGLDNIVAPGGPKFVKNHVDEMNYCENPGNANLHGAVMAIPYIAPLMPSFAMSRTHQNGDLLFPPIIQYDLNPENELSFRDKPIHKIMWRGSPDGVHIAPMFNWRHSHRFRMLYLTQSNDTSQTRPLRQTRVDRIGKEYQIDEQVNLAELNERYSAIRPTDTALQCEEYLCPFVMGSLQFVKKASLEHMSQHRYVMDVDGNSYSARFRTHLLSNQVVFKSTLYPEFYSDRIQPWLHYVPIAQDYSDLYNALAFFDGGIGPDREGNHDDLAEKIAVAGKVWAEKHWRFVDQKAYVFRLLLEWGRLFSEEREPEYSGNSKFF